jgi:23S rRNA (cytidine1920-2'-O)/16S rRNA (cytidine1409-2'-O)-methyltransferase
MGKRKRLDTLLVDRGLVASREEGRGRILAGDVLVNEQPSTKAGTLIDEHAAIRVKSKARPYASRGGSKLETALQRFDIEVDGKIVLDVGASTGGFSDCLLAHGARQIFAVDVGYGQLDWRLRNDPRVVVFEKTNIRYLELSALPCPADIATIDVSFISLKLVLPYVKALLRPENQIVALIKPQFEVGKGKVGKGGVVRSHDEHLRVIEEIRVAATALNYGVRGVIESPLLGPAGNKEFFIHLSASQSAL